MDAERILEILTHTDEANKALSRAVVGDPIERDGLTIVPLARVVARGGVTRAARGSSVVVEPVGYLEIRDGEAQFVPIVAPNSPVGILGVVPCLAEAWERLRKKR
ncbi:hypothetical protein D6792_01995 [Candidatus Parcubacteria bacterium]|nr:MAG: hypothetical protein D6792_01995 [Candidatus Parcubacteria bacterium]GIW69222.1 MAG: hypothetical protein KatS3mg100_716 [Candidatus Parcubacteria bacterium]